MTTKKKLGQILLEAEVIDEYQLKSALGFQKKWGGRLGSVLVENRFITEEVLVQAIQQQTGIASVQLSNRTIPDYLTKLVPLELAEQHHLIPIGLEGEAGKPSETLIVATSDPTNLTALDELRFKTGKRVKPVLAGEKDIERAIAVHYRGEADGGLDFDVDPEGIQFGGPEVEAAALDNDMVVVQGTLEAGPVQGGAAEDPFAELASLGAPAASGGGAAEPAPPPVPAVDDPFAELDALVGTAGPTAGQDHPSASDLDFDLDGPSTAADGDEPEILEDLEIVEDFEQIDPVPAPAAPPAPAPSPAPGQAAADSDLFGQPEDLDALPDLDQPADLSGVPDLEPADPTPVVPAPTAPAATGLDDLPDLEPASPEQDIPTVQGQQVAPSPFATDDESGESTADLLLDADDLDLDAVLEPISDEQAEGDAPPAGPAGPAGQTGGEPTPSTAAQNEPAAAGPVEEGSAGDEKPKPDSVPTQVISMSDMPSDPGPQPEQQPTGGPSEGEDAPAQGPEPKAPAGAEETPESAAAETSAEPSDLPSAAPAEAEPEPAVQDAQAPEADGQEDKVKSDAMKALLSRVGLSKGSPGQATNARSAPAAGARGPAGDPTLAALVRVMIKKGLITAEELQQELEGE